eukprot:scaffold6190_cov34-Phaeocystis_antarctica.AAC.1
MIELAKSEKKKQQADQAAAARSRMQALLSRGSMQSSHGAAASSDNVDGVQSLPGAASARWTVMELFMMDRHQLQQAAALVIMLDIHPFRHTSTARSRWPASSQRAAAAARRSARGPHAPRSSPRARTAATSAASEETNGIREANTAGT